ncbi:hypothetical protein CVT24_006213 [Panaeolus cyanescens]|uniref:Uncharacterized protein n=1 Tax=Panaeolus cyanescens TaxID=181874 RepID=A0A409YEJ0_9AGAR|nr:hypothetical protein CVT24_006213 [Panaeolus cyanescens]
MSLSFSSSGTGDQFSSFGSLDNASAYDGLGSSSPFASNDDMFRLGHGQYSTHRGVNSNSGRQTGLDGDIASNPAMLLWYQELKKEICALRAECSKVTSERDKAVASAEILQREYGELKKRYQDLEARKMRGIQGFILPDCQSFSKFEYPSRSRHPRIRFWTKSQFDKRNASKSQHDSSEGGIHQVNSSGRDNDDNMPCTKYYFVEFYLDNNPDNNPIPQVITKGMKKRIKEGAYYVFNSLHMLYNCAPETFGGNSIEGLQFYRSYMYQLFPFLAYCEFDWKVDYIGTQEYPQWSRSKTLPSPGVMRSGGANVVDLTADDSDNPPVTKRKFGNNDARKSKKQKLTQQQEGTQTSASAVDPIADPEVEANPVTSEGQGPVGVVAAGTMHAEQAIGNVTAPVTVDTGAVVTANTVHQIVGRMSTQAVDTSSVVTVRVVPEVHDVGIGSVANVEPVQSNDAAMPESLNTAIGPVQSSQGALPFNHPLGNRQEHAPELTIGPATRTDNAGTTEDGAKTKQKVSYFKFAPKRFDEWNLFGKEFAAREGRQLTKDEVLSAYGVLSEAEKLSWTEKRKALELLAPPAGKKGTRAKK